MEELGRTYFFRNLDGAELELVKDLTSILEVKTDEIIIEQGHASDHLYIVRTGKVRVMVPLPEDAPEGSTPDQTLVVLGPGECFGEFAYVDGEPASARCVAGEDTTVYAIARDKLEPVLLKHPHAASMMYRALVHVLVSRFRNTDIELAIRRAMGG